MESGSQFIPNIHGRSGAWQTVHDSTTPNATMFPPDGTFPMSPTGDPCRLLAAHVYGGQFALFSSFQVGLGGPYNATAYRGITFWAKVAPSTSNVIRVNFPDKDTDPASGICSTVSTPVVAPNVCWDHFGKPVTFQTTWTKVTILFSELAQLGWGNLATQFDPATLYRIEWAFAQNAKFDVWVDDIAFLTQ
jgi:hypothetical protein